MAAAPCPDPHPRPAAPARVAGARAWRHALVAVCLATACAGPAQAIDPDSELARQLQAERRQRLELVIARSSEQIESPAVEGPALAAAFRARGVARGHLLQHAEALQDLERAVEMDPFNAQYYEDRARAHLKLREFDAARTDLDMALGLDSKRWTAQRDKGRVAAYQGDFQQARSEFVRAFRLADDEASPYNALWLEIASRRAGGEGTRIVEELVAQMSPDEWPAPLLRMFRGTLSPTEMIRTAASIDPRKAFQQLCEANFYAGQLHLLRGEREAAKAAFEAVVATGVVEYLEYDWALREMELLKSGR